MTKVATKINGVSALLPPITNFVERVNADGGTVENLRGLGEANGSLCIIPSGKKVGKIYAINPTDGSGDTAFSRSSDATYIDKNGIMQTALVDEPRIDYSDGVGKLLIEASSENLIKETDISLWSKTNNNYVNKILTPIANGTNYSLYNSTVVIGNTYTQSVIVEYKGGYEWVQLFASTGFNSTNFINFNVNTGLFGNSGTENHTYKAEKIAGTNKYKLSITLQATSNSSLGRVAMSIMDMDYTMRNPSITASAINGIYVEYPQLEVGNKRTSYIPTNGTTQVRSADVPAPITNLLNVTKITETFADGTVNEITTIPTSYTLPNNLTKLIMK